MVSEAEGVLRLLVTFGLTFVLGFDGSCGALRPGNRTFSLIGLGAAVIGLLFGQWPLTRSPGPSPGSGIGAGLVFRQKTAPRSYVG